MLLASVALVVTAATTNRTVLTAAEPARFATGSDFRHQLNLPLLANRGRVPLGEMLDHLASDRRVALLIDRRVDPDQLIDVDVRAPYFDAAISDLLQPLGAGVSVVADTLYIGPLAAAQTLRTRILLSERQLDGLIAGDIKRQFDLARRLPVRWNPLSTPREILSTIAQRYGLELPNADEIPYDLWAEGGIAHANAVEALSLIVTQFGLDLHWVSAKEVRFVPQDPRPLIRSEHVFPGLTIEQALDKVRERFPELLIEAGAEKLAVTGRIEEQEAVSELLGNRAPRKPAAAVARGTLANRRFSLRMIDRPFLELVSVLQKQGIQVEYDAAALERAGVDLNRRMTVELENAPIQKLLSEACGPLQLDYRVDGTTIELFPRK